MIQVLFLFLCLLNSAFAAAPSWDPFQEQTALQATGSKAEIVLKPVFVDLKDPTELSKRHSDAMEIFKKKGALKFTSGSILRESLWNVSSAASARLSLFSVKIFGAQQVLNIYNNEELIGCIKLSKDFYQGKKIIYFQNYMLPNAKSKLNWGDIIVLLAANIKPYLASEKTKLISGFSSNFNSNHKKLIEAGFEHKFFYRHIRGSAGTTSIPTYYYVLNSKRVAKI